jgi:hypothetical protein
VPASRELLAIVGSPGLGPVGGLWLVAVRECVFGRNALSASYRLFDNLRFPSDPVEGDSGKAREGVAWLAVMVGS